MDVKTTVVSATMLTIGWDEDERVAGIKPAGEEEYRYFNRKTLKYLIELGNEDAVLALRMMNQIEGAEEVNDGKN